MKQLLAFTKKECMELTRSGKLLILTALFCFFGILNPLMAKLTPWLMEAMSGQLAENGFIVGQIEVTAMTSWTQYFKNIPVAMIVFLVCFSGILTGEYQKGTLVNVITKGLSRWKIILSKTLVMAAAWTICSLLCFGITWGYNAYLWDNGVAQNVTFAAFACYLLGLWLLSVIPLASVLGRSASTVTLFTGAAFLISYLLGLFPKFQAYTPTYLMGSAELLTGLRTPGDYLWAAVITLGLALCNIAIAVAAFNKKNI